MDTVRGYRRRNEQFDRLITAAMSNEFIAKTARRSVHRADSAVRSLRKRRPGAGRYDEVFFVAGEMRSGTSWLRRTLSAHPEIVCGHEGSFFGLDYDREEIPVYTGAVSSFTRALANSDEFRVWHGLPWNQWTDEYEEDVRNLTRRSLDYFLEKEVLRTGKKIVGDKSPQHTENIDEIHEYYPDAKIVHIVRDGRDVAVSAMNHWWRLARDQPGGMFDLDPQEIRNRNDYNENREAYIADGRSIFTEERLAQLATRWSHRVAKAHTDGTSLYGDGYIELRYEDLLGRPQQTLAEILTHLNARCTEEVLDRCIDASSFEKVSSRSQGEEDSGSFFRKGISGDWQNVFTERDREIYQNIASEQLRASGYEI